MIREATAMNVRQNFGELLNEVNYRHDSVVITKGGKPMAAMIDMQLFENIRRMKEEFERSCAEIAEAFKDVPEEQGMALAMEASKWARKNPKKG